MPITGHDSWQTAINDPGTNTAYSGSHTGAVSGEWVCIVALALGDNSANNPSAWSLAINGTTLNTTNTPSLQVIDGPSNTAVMPAVKTWLFRSPASGTLAVDVTTANTIRAFSAVSANLAGLDATTQIVASGVPGSYNANTSSLDSPATHTPAAAGNVIIGGLSIKGGDGSIPTATGPDGTTGGKNGSNQFTDNAWAVGWKTAPDTSAVTFAWSWTGNNDRAGGIWFELKAATGGGSNIDADMAGSLGLGGLISVSVGVTADASPALSLGGSTDVTPVVTADATSPLDLAGNVTADPAVTIDSAAQISLAGAATATPTVLAYGAGGLQLSGAASLTVGNELLVNIVGQLALGGSIGLDVAVTADVAGQLAFGASASLSPVTLVDASGQVSLGGTGDLLPAITLDSAGVIGLMGSATATPDVLASLIGEIQLHGVCSAYVGVMLRQLWSVEYSRTQVAAISPRRIIARLLSPPRVNAIRIGG